MLNKYIYAEATQDYWPQIRTVSAKSYNDAVEKVINEYSNNLDDDDLLKCYYWEEFREKLNDSHTIALSDLEIYEEI
jgi:hypoxanthine phosphoribosyltransferase